MQDVNDLNSSLGPSAVPMFAGLEDESLITRLFRAVSLNLRDFSRDPSGYLKGLFTSEREVPLIPRLLGEARQNLQDFSRSPVGYVKAIFVMTDRESQRAELLLWCMASAFFAFVATFGVFFIIPRLIYPPPPIVAEQKQDLQLISMVEPPPPPVTKTGGGAGLGAKKPGGGGGGGGNNEPTPASKGRLPQASLNPIVAPSTHQRIEQPSLPVPAAVLMDPSLLPKQDMNLPLGDPKGVPGPPSDGPGSGGGIGSGRGGGVGSGEGGGVGPGRGGGMGGGDAGGPGGGGGGANLRPTILSQVKPKYTEEARQNKIQGKVVLSVEFRADGTIGDIRIVKSLGYGLDEQAISAARQIRFRPAVSGGNPVTSRARVEYSFNLI